MNTHTDKAQDNKSQLEASAETQHDISGISTFQFVDNRPEAITQRKLQGIANNSPQVKQLKAVQGIANNSPQVRQATQLKPVDNSHISQQHPPIQKKSHTTSSISSQQNSTIQLQANNSVVQLLSNSEKARLEAKMGKPKTAKVITQGLGDAFHEKGDDELDMYKRMSHEEFDGILQSMKSDQRLGRLELPASIGANLGAGADLLGAAVETGEDLAAVSAAIPGTQALSGLLSATSDSGLEAFGGSVGGIKDIIEGGMDLNKPGKKAEASLGILSGLGGLYSAAAPVLSSALPIPDAIGIAGASMKSVGGITKMANVRGQVNAINALKAESNIPLTLEAALDILYNELGYGDGAWQTVSGGAEAVGGYFGGAGKYAASLSTKALETSYSWLPYLARATASTVAPSRFDSNAKKSQEEQSQKDISINKIKEAVKDENITVDWITKLYRIAEKIDPDYAHAIHVAINSISDSTKRSEAKAAISS